MCSMHISLNQFYFYVNIKLFWIIKIYLPGSDDGSGSDFGSSKKLEKKYKLNSKSYFDSIKQQFIKNLKAVFLNNICNFIKHFFKWILNNIQDIFRWLIDRKEYS